ncbi:hypothetical protein RclHR1_05740004 [Rhizophagus clarus]|uniref:Uncharacterized protein n=1 Tax=Rhizophagus clarus TaxID=94130 RepID=A0A2Z6S770_9GLOM|nr:hypothetical protein RclHR1_05740004 [Rhizophagus clarus]GES99079.1 hypothetical protein GLOIN_2v1817539 [Rhizophagus clarus]
MDQIGNNFTPLHSNNNGNIQHSSNNDVEMSNMSLNTLHYNNINAVTSTPQNETFEFYSPLPNDTRIYHLQQHQSVQSLIQQQIQQQVQQPVVYQQRSIQQQSFDTIQPSQVYSNNNTYDTASISVNGTVSHGMQDTRNAGSKQDSS